MTQERVVYINGEMVPESEAKVSFRDQGFVTGGCGLRCDPHFRRGDIQTDRACRPVV